MDTTFNAVFIFDKNMKIINIGDSRTYLIRESEIYRLTKDHSLFQENIDKGLSDENEIENLIPKNIITKAVGIKENIEQDIYTFDLKNNDRVILVTDGIHDLLSDEEIFKIMSKERIDRSYEKLIKICKQKGEFDNMTVVSCLIKSLG